MCVCVFVLRDELLRERKRATKCKKESEALTRSRTADSDEVVINKNFAEKIRGQSTSGNGKLL